MRKISRRKPVTRETALLGAVNGVTLKTLLRLMTLVVIRLQRYPAENFKKVVPCIPAPLSIDRGAFYALIAMLVTNALKFIVHVVGGKRQPGGWSWRCSVVSFTLFEGTSRIR